MKSSGKPPVSDITVILFSFTLIWLISVIPIFLSPLGNYPVIDASWHNLWAKAVSEGDVFIYAPYFRAPLYPLTLGCVYSLFGSSLLVGNLLSFLFTIASIYLIHLIVYRKVGRIPAMVAAALWALNGVTVFYGSVLLITPMYIFLLLMAYFFLDRPTPSSFGWLFLGLAAVTRPGIVLLFPFLLFLYKKIWKKSWLFLIPIVIVWGVNSFYGDPLTPISSQAGVNFYIGSGPDADGFTAFAPSTSAEPEDSLPYLDNVWVASNSPFETRQSPAFVSKWWSMKTFEGIVKNPFAFVKLIGKKVVYLISPVEIPSNYDVYYFGKYSPFLQFLIGTPQVPVPGLLLWFLFPGALLAGKISADEKKLLFWIFGLGIGILPFFVTARFRLPILPFMVILLVPRFYGNLKKNLLLGIPGLGLGLLLAAITGFTVPAGGVNMSFYDGLAHYNAGREAEAELLFLEAVEVAFKRSDRIDLNGSDALYNLGVICLKRGELDSAQSYFEMAVGRNPAYRSIVSNFWD